MTETSSTTPADTTRGGYIAGLRALADLLHAHPDVPLPFHGAQTAIRIYTHQREPFIAAAKALPGKWDKIYDEDSSFGIELRGALHGLALEVLGPRDQVCERIVVGTETVTVPAQPAVEARPARIETREVVEWRCQPLLADTDPIPVTVLSDDEAGVLR